MPTRLTTPPAAEAPAARRPRPHAAERALDALAQTQGQWFEDVDPYMNDVWLRIPLADRAALDDALAAAGGRAETRPAIVESRRAGIVDWLVPLEVN